MSKRVEEWTKKQAREREKYQLWHEMRHFLSCSNRSSTPIAPKQPIVIMAQISGASDSLGIHTQSLTQMGDVGKCILKSFHLMYNSHFIISWSLTIVTTTTSTPKKRAKWTKKNNRNKFHCCHLFALQKKWRNTIVFRTIHTLLCVWCRYTNQSYE